MARQGPDNTKTTESVDGDGGGGKKKPIKVMLGVVVILGLEAATIFGTAMLTNKPQIASGDPFLEDQMAAEERIVEVPVLNQRFPNRKSGVIMLYETNIAVQVKKKNEEKVKQIIEENSARIKMAIGTIWRNAEPRHFNEPYLNTLTRQAREMLTKIIDEGLPEDEESRVAGVLIPVLTGWRSDG